MTKKQERQARVVERLEAQLSSGVKKLKDGSGFVSLTEADTKRIKTELKTLKGLI